MEKVDRSSAKRLRSLEAARFLILRDGLRATTMEAIAREAGIAKPTLYAQFPDKTAVFAALVDLTLTEVLEAADAGFATQGAVYERIGEALARQYLAISAILSGSPHADELMEEPRRTDLQLKERHFRIEARIVEELRAAGVEDASYLARVLIAAAHGISIKIREPDVMSSAIKLATRRLVEPELT
ncbi:MAG: TetR/AcrR family transcriptional regulator [Hyphomicrobium sp.]|jgi:AcrR family transcriptional regulator|uniref:TetR/AcrR family transcriptional regulator n=1 Tax=Hyphomicrobium sp. TaxID=82 RepID=UPI0025BD96C8|nr:TetR/AcrR family transcriptional regulator [Hyphomicrobium sp.]MBX9863900.1 TetR/AcrR family transcriptional regulator [Hyphomicrobium sp.]